MCAEPCTTAACWTRRLWFQLAARCRNHIGRLAHVEACVRNLGICSPFGVSRPSGVSGRSEGFSGVSSLESVAPQGGSDRAVCCSCLRAGCTRRTLPSVRVEPTDHVAHWHISRVKCRLIPAILDLDAEDVFLRSWNGQRSHCVIQCAYEVLIWEVIATGPYVSYTFCREKYVPECACVESFGSPHTRTLL